MPVLTDAAVRRFKPGSKRREIPDVRAAGLYLVIQPTSGAKSWHLRCRRPDGCNGNITLGSVDFSGRELTGDPVIGQPLTLAAARLLAADLHRQRAMGIDIFAETAAAKRRRRAEREQAGASTFGVLARQFVEEHARLKVRRWREIAYILGLRDPLDGDGEPTEARDGLAERWANKPVSAIDPHIIYQSIDEARRRGVPGIKPRTKGLSDPRGRKVARALSKFFAWCLQHRKVAASPCIGMYVPPPPASRERVLSADEMRWLWKGCDAIGAPFGPMCKLLLLCGVRREEARAMTRAEISADGTLWSIPSARTKNRKAHSVPLSPLAREIIATMPRIESVGGYVFTIDGRAVPSRASPSARSDSTAPCSRRPARSAGRAWRSPHGGCTT
jgi:integrase